MIIQGLNNVMAAYGAATRTAATRQTSTGSTANNADQVSISNEALALLSKSQSSNTQDAAIQQRLAEIKAKPGVERTEADTEYLSRTSRNQTG